MILEGVREFPPWERDHPDLPRSDGDETRMGAVETFVEAAVTVGSCLSCEHALHVFPSFGIGGVPLRLVRIINHLGQRFRHTIIALDNNFDAAAAIGRDVDVTILPAPAVGRGMIRNLTGSAHALRRLRPDLLLTYNWGAIEWAAASRFAPIGRHLHLEAGFGRDEADSQMPRRVLFRRWALARCALVVV